MTEPNGDHTQPAPGDSDAVQLYDQAKAHAEQGRIEQAIADCDQALALEPGLPMALQLRAVLALRQEDQETATEQFRKLTQVVPDSAEAWFNLGNALYNVGRFEDALEPLEECLARTDNAIAQTLKGLCLRELDRGEEAEACLEAALEHQSEYLPAMATLATMRSRAGRHEEAITLFRRVVELKPDLGPSHVNLGNALLEAGEAEAAADAYRTALTLDPQLLDARVGLAKIAEQRGEVDEAISHLRRILRRRPGNSAITARLAELLIENRREPEALLVLEAGMQHEPGNERLKEIRAGIETA